MASPNVMTIGDEIQHSKLLSEIKNYENTLKPERYTAIYARSSSKDGKDSVETQIDRCITKANSEKLIIYREYQDLESGKQFRYEERAGFTNLLNDMKAGMFKTIILYKRDRLTRRTDDYLRLMDLFKKYDIRIIYTEEPEPDLHNGDFISQFMENMFFVVSTLEPERIAYNSKVGLESARRNGKYFKSGNLPFGYTEDANSAVIKDVKDKLSYYRHTGLVEQVKDIFNQFLLVDKQINKDGSKYTYNAWRNYIEQILLKAPTKYSLLKTDPLKVMRNPVYAGKIVCDYNLNIDNIIHYVAETDSYMLDEDMLIPTSNIYGIVDYEIWKEAALKAILMDSSKIKAKNKYFLKNKLICYSCNKPLTFDGINYSCKKGCLNFEKEDLYSIIIERIILDIDQKHILRLIDIRKRVSMNTLKKLKKCYTDNENKLRDKMFEVMNFPDSENHRKELSELYNQSNSYKTEISTIADTLSQLSWINTNMNFFKHALYESIKGDEQKIAHDSKLELLIDKVVLKKKDHEKERNLEIIYTRR